MASNITVYYATNRHGPVQEDGETTFTNGFQSDNPDYYRVGWASVRADKGKYSLKNIEVAPETHAESGDDADAELGSTKLFREIKSEMKVKGRDLIVLIHGYSSDIDTALERGAELADKYKVKGKDGKTRAPVVMVFSWPSKGKMIPFASYISDRDYAAKSGRAIGRLFLRLCDFLLKEAVDERRNRDDETARSLHEPCPGRIHLVAHSMGNWALRNAVQAIIEFRGMDRLPSIFDNIFLMAADEDEDTLHMPNKLGPLPKLGNAVHVYHSKDDQALVISDTTKLNPDRLGHNGPEVMDRTDAKVIAIDCRHVDNTGLGDANHQYYRLRGEVLNDVKQVLAGSLPQQVKGRTALPHARRYMINKPPSSAKSSKPSGTNKG